MLPNYTVELWDIKLADHLQVTHHQLRIKGFITHQKEKRFAICLLNCDNNLYVSGQLYMGVLSIVVS